MKKYLYEADFYIDTASEEKGYLEKGDRNYGI